MRKEKSLTKKLRRSLIQKTISLMIILTLTLTKKTIGRTISSKERSIKKHLGMSLAEEHVVAEGQEQEEAIEAIEVIEEAEEGEEEAEEATATTITIRNTRKITTTVIRKTTTRMNNQSREIPTNKAIRTTKSPLLS